MITKQREPGRMMGRAFQSPAWRRRALRFHGFTPRVERRPWPRRQILYNGTGSRCIIWWDGEQEIAGTEAAWQVLSRRLSREDRCW